jgi:hypothetical protein
MPAERDVAVRYCRAIRTCITCAVIAAAPCAALAQNGSGWWPFGGGAKSSESLPEVSEAPPATDPPQYLDEPMNDSTGGWPNVHLPEIKWRPLWSRPGDPQQGVLNGPIDRVRAAGRNSVASARGAWNGTVDKFKWGGTTARDQQYAQRQQQLRQQQASNGQQQPGFWDRLFGKEPEEPDGPKTVVEWMAQERPGMTK